MIRKHSFKVIHQVLEQWNLSEMFLVNLPVAHSVHRTTRNVFAWSIIGVTVVYVPVINRITATGAYMRHRFSWALFKLNNILNFCPFATLDSSKCS